MIGDSLVRNIRIPPTEFIHTYSNLSFSGYPAIGYPDNTYRVFSGCEYVS